MPKFLVYKLITDNGGAPCVTSDLLSLAICKPSIRSAAHTGDWIFGFGDNDGLQNRLIYIAEVTGKLAKSAYYLADLFASRVDCIYERDTEGYLQRTSNARFHTEDDKTRDVGHFPDYRRANVVLSTNFRYFGRVASPNVPTVLEIFVHQMGQGHRSNFDRAPGVWGALDALRDEAWKKFPQMRIGKPTHADLSRKCNR
jgi:hypothetical protein